MFDSNEEHLFPLLLKNLPSKIHCSNNKSGAFSKASVLTNIALKNYNFIEFNSKKRITIVVFDKDKHEDITALEYFNDIPTFYVLQPIYSDRLPEVFGQFESRNFLSVKL